MILCDKDIKNRAGDIFLAGYDEGNVGCVLYDLTHEETDIKPHGLRWLECREIVCVPSDLVVRVVPRNCALRVGLRVEGALYFPGHKTRIALRVENLTGKTVRLNGSVAQLVFEETHIPEKLYNGKYQKKATLNYDGAFVPQQFKIDIDARGDYIYGKKTLTEAVAWYFAEMAKVLEEKNNGHMV